MRTVLLILALSWTAALFGGENWPEFRGPRGDGSSTAKGLPVKWSDTENVKWKTAIEGKAWSSPVVWDRQIWVTNAPEDGKQLFAVCVDAESGKIVHNLLVFEIANPQFCYPMNSYATPTPVVEEGRLYVHFGTHGTACLDTASGKTLWTREDLHCNHHRGPASSPILAGNLLILTFDGFDVQYLVGLDKENGKTVWQKNRLINYGTDDGDAKKAYGTPLLVALGGKSELISPSAGATIAYAPDTGKELWRVRSGGMNASARPLFGNGLLYVTTAAGGFQLFAVKPGGSGDVTQSNVAWKSSKSIPTRSSQLLVGDLLFMISDAGVASCIDAKTGETVWQKRLDGAYSASPLLADGKIYFFSESGATPVIEAAREFKLLAENKLPAGFMASPAVYDQSLILRTKTHLYRIAD
jgi:outer membrane protein assembly factor BamB